MEVIIILRFCSFYLKYKVKEENALALWLFVTFAQLVMLHACIKAHRPRVCCLWKVLEERNRFGIS